MLGSEHEGERATAARLATLELRRLGLTWAQLIDKAFPAAPQPGYRPAQESYQQRSWAQSAWAQGRKQYNRGAPYTAEMNGVLLWDIVTAADQNRDRLNAWEGKFVDNFLATRRKEGSPNEWVILMQIAQKLGDLAEV